MDIKNVLHYLKLTICYSNILQLPQLEISEKYKIELKLQDCEVPNGHLQVTNSKSSTQRTAIHTVDKSRKVSLLSMF